MDKPVQSQDVGSFDVAVTGLAIRVPGATNAARFWELVAEGREAVRRLTDAELRAAGVPEAVRSDPRYVPAASILEDVDQFDAAFFGYGPKEATQTDPQVRVALEVAWEAIEDAGHDLRRDPRRVGVFATASSPTYLLNNLHSQLNLTDFFLSDGNLQRLIGSGHDFLAPRLGYKLGLRGPCVNVHSACSSALVAVHLARQSLLSGECDIAIAGGASIYLPQAVGYIAQEGLILSHDGHCRPFDADATGTIFGRGAGFVVLKRLDDAIADRDHVYAVIKGSAVNNDGDRKVGFTAPGLDGQAAVVAEALADAGVAPDSIGYIEAHATGTEQGDPIEMAALTQAFRARTDRVGFCAVGSVKANIGHLDVASGVIGFIKTVLALHHGELPPAANFSRPNPAIDFATSPFYVNTARRTWVTSGGRKRRAGISAFGMGGTNAHVVVEEAPAPAAGSGDAGRTREVLTLSGKSAAAVTALAARYATALERDTAEALADVCFTAHEGRAAWTQRVAVVGDTRARVVAQLRDVAAGQTPAGVVRGEVRSGRRPKVAWLFTGQGTPYAGMGTALLTQPAYRTAVEACAAAMAPYLEVPLLEVLRDARVTETASAQPALFAVQYGLAALWQAWGVRPEAVLGHSVGEYAAACVAGVLDLPTAARLVATRGRLMQALPGTGAMAAVWAPAATVRAALSAEVTIAAVNGPALVVVAGPAAAVTAVCAQLDAAGVRTERLPVAQAFHTPQMRAMVPAFAAAAAGVTPTAGRVPWVSSVTGTWAEAGTGSAAYWTAQIEAPVQFGGGLATLVEAGYDAFVELGPTATLVGLGRASYPALDAVWGPSLRAGQDAWATVLETLGALWTRGTVVDWRGFDAVAPRRKVALPTYPFQRQRFWMEFSPAPERLPTAASERSEPVQPASDAVSPSAAHYAVEWRDSGEAIQEIDTTHLPLPIALARASSDAAMALPDRQAVASVAAAEGRVDRACAAYVWEALSQLGWHPISGGRFATGELGHRLGIGDRHRRLFARLLEILREDGILTRHGSVWTFSRPPADSAAHLVAGVREQCPAFAAELKILVRCGEALNGVLTGRIDPLSVLFPTGETSDLETVYGNTPTALFYNTLAAAAVAREAAARTQDVPLRVLEIGGGTGGTARHMLAALRGPVKYVFTDISTYLTSRAAATFGASPHVECRVLDIERSPHEQGFAGEQFDVVIAANVLHATRDLSETLRHVRELCAPGALLLLWENVRMQRWVDLVFGLTDGWWRFSDFSRRPDHAVISTAEWQQILSEAGMQDAAAWTNPDLDDPSYALIFARGPSRSPAEAVAASAATPALLILADSGDAASNLARAAAADGWRVSIVRDRLAAAIQTALVNRPASTGITYVVCLWALDAPPCDDWSSAAVADWQTSMGLAVAQLATSLKNAPSGDVRFWLVTRGTQCVSADTRLNSAECMQAPLWGWGRTLRLEAPAIWGGLIDLDPDDVHEYRRMLRVMIGSRAEDELVLRGGRRYVPRLVERTWPDQGPLSLDPDASYLVTGGLGDIGLEIAQWLARSGARHLILVGRTGIDRTEGDGATGSERRRVVRLLEERGVEVRVELANVADAAAMSAVFTRARAERHVRGVIHAAGVSIPTAIEDLDRETIDAITQPKIAGAWNLHRHSLADPLDFFVLFSSAAAVWGSKRLGPYAAANQFMDALVDLRRRDGLPALSISWGRWQGNGMVSAAAHDWLEQIGLAAFAPDEGVKALETLIQNVRSGRGTVAAVDWRRFRAFYEASACDALLREIHAPDQAGLPAPAPIAPGAVLEHTVRDQVADALGIPAMELRLDVPINSYGFDSLMAVRVRDRLQTQFGFTIPVAEFMKGRTVLELVSHVKTSPGTAGTMNTHHGVGLAIDQVALAVASDDVEEMSDSDVDAELRRLLSGGGARD